MSEPKKPKEKPTTVYHDDADRKRADTKREKSATEKAEKPPKN